MHPEVVKEKHTCTEGAGKRGVLILIFMQTPNWPTLHSSVSFLIYCILVTEVLFVWIKTRLAQVFSLSGVQGVKS